MLERSLYDTCLCADFVDDGCDGTATIETYAVSVTTLVSGTEWGETAVDCGVNSDGNVG